MTSELQQNRYDRLIRRVGGIIGVGSKVSEVLTELFPMIDVEGNRGELQLLSGVTLGMGSTFMANVAGERVRAGLFNPSDSNNIVTITDIYIGTNTTQQMHVGRSTIELPSGIGTQLARDTRQSLVDRPVGRMATDSLVAAVDANMIFRVASTNSMHITMQNDVMILAPGNGIQVGCALADTQLIISFLWRERPAETSELNF